MSARQLLFSAITLLTGIAIGVLARPDSVLAQFIQWNRDEVVAILPVEPSLGHFVAKGGSVLQGQWDRGKVVPIIQVKPYLGGFVPVEGQLPGLSWAKSEVKPFALVKPGPVGGFVPVQ